MIKVLYFQESNDVANMDRNAKPQILVGVFNISIINRSDKEKINKASEIWNNTRLLIY